MIESIIIGQPLRLVPIVFFLRKKFFSPSPRNGRDCANPELRLYDKRKRGGDYSIRTEQSGGDGGKQW